jgi:poly [ADP-ribose] polymerase
VISGGDAKKENPIDHHYRGLNCTLTSVDHEDVAFGIVDKYVQQTHAKTHSQYRLEVQEVFRVARQGEEDNFKDVGNR